MFLLQRKHYIIFLGFSQFQIEDKSFSKDVCIYTDFRKVFNLECSLVHEPFILFFRYLKEPDQLYESSKVIISVMITSTGRECHF